MEGKKSRLVKIPEVGSSFGRELTGSMFPSMVFADSEDEVRIQAGHE